MMSKKEEWIKKIEDLLNDETEEEWTDDGLFNTVIYMNNRIDPFEFRLIDMLIDEFFDDVVGDMIEEHEDICEDEFDIEPWENIRENSDCINFYQDDAEEEIRENWENYLDKLIYEINPDPVIELILDYIDYLDEDELEEVYNILIGKK